MKIRKPRGRGLTRRDVIATASAAGVAASAGPFFHVNPARAAKTLKILQWSHFVIPQYHIPYDRIAYWKKFGRPEITPSQGVQFDTWWIK